MLLAVFEKVKSWETQGMCMWSRRGGGKFLGRRKPCCPFLQLSLVSSLRILCVSGWESLFCHLSLPRLLVPFIITPSVYLLSFPICCCSKQRERQSVCVCVYLLPHFCLYHLSKIPAALDVDHPLPRPYCLRAATLLVSISGAKRSLQRGGVGWGINVLNAT